MRVALVIEAMDPSRGGREISTAQIATGLARLGCDVTVLCRSGSWPDDRVKIEQLGRRGMLRVSRMSNFVAAAGAAAAGGDYDVVHAMLPVSGADVYQPRGGTVPGQIEASVRRWKLAGPLRKAVFEPLNLSRRRLGRLERALVADTSVMCLAVSEMVAQEFTRHYGRSDNVRVVYNGVEIPSIDPEDWAQWRQQVRYKLGVGQDDPVFISVATNFPLKGVTEAIRAFSKWLDRGGCANARLVVVGRELVEGYRRLAGMRGVGSRVVFVPPTREILQWYAAADACILLSWYDPCSRTVLEATTLGIPSITTVYNGAAEILADGAGFVVRSPDDISATVAALEALADPQTRARCRQACAQAAGAASMARHVEQLLGIYEEVARRR